MIVSAVQGGPDVITDCQIALATAGKRNGVRRILPSEFALDLFKATLGEHPAFDARRNPDEAIAAIGLEQVNILQGGFIELFKPGVGAIDLDKGTIASSAIAGGQLGLLEEWLSGHRCLIIKLATALAAGSRARTAVSGVNP